MKSFLTKRLSVIAFAVVSLLATSVFSPSQALANGQWAYTGSMNSYHNNSIMTTLQNGRVFVISGSDNVSELYNESTGQWDQQGNVNDARAGTSAVLLDNGKVLIAGGSTVGPFDALSSAELFDPSSGQWSYTGSMNLHRYCPSLIKLSDGKVLAASGTTGNFSQHYTSEIYDPSTGQWSYTSNVVSPVADCEGASHSVLLNNGKVLLVGGFLGSNSSTTQLYDPSTGQWSATGDLQVARSATKVIKLQNGKVLIIGGNQAGGSNLTDCELYDPATGLWTETGSLNNAQRVTHAVLLSNGKVFIAGGQSSDGGAVLAGEIYDPATGLWSLEGSTNEGHSLGALAQLTNGTILLAGGQGNGTGHPLTKTAEIYTFVFNEAPQINQFSGGTINEGDTYSASGSFSDSDSTSWTATVDYGDGSGEHAFAAPNETLDQTNKTFSISHVYKDNSNTPYTVTVKITDNQGATGSKSASVTVNNVAPHVDSIIAPAMQQINTSFTASTTFSDPGVLDTHTATWNWGDGSTQDACPPNTSHCTLTESNGSGSVSGTHTYTTPGVYRITLTVTDKDGGQTPQTFSYVSAYDINSAFTGGHSFDNPTGASPNTSGKVSFGVTAKYNNNGVLNGSARMNFKNENIDFVTNTLSSLVTSNGKAYLYGQGTVNGSGTYDVLVTGIDGGNSGTDYVRFRIKNHATGALVYDSQPAATSDTTDPTTPVIIQGNQSGIQIQ